MLTVPPVKVKGLLKGLRYISGIFENEKEQEMVIGNPTDVKHVAHIGFDGPVVNNPAWMNDFHSAPLSASVEREKQEVGSPKTASQEIPLGRIPPPSPARDEKSSRPRRTRRHSSSDAPGSDSPSREGGSRHSRKNSSSEAAGSESPAREGGSRHSRKHHSAGSGSTPGSKSPARDPEPRSSRLHNRSDNPTGSECKSPARDFPSIPRTKKKDRRSKASDDGSTRSSHTSKKSPFSDTGLIAQPIVVEEEA